MLIAFEGIDGSGKTTLSKELVRFLNSRGVDAVWTREPYSRELREVLKTKSLSPWGETHLFLADRDLHLREFVKPKLEEGKVVVTDRYYLSTLAYQGYGRGLNLKTLKNLNEKIVGDLKPDLTVLIDLDETEALERIRRSRSSADRFENEEFLKKVRKGFKNLIKKEKNYLILDGSKSRYELLGEVIAAVGRLLKRRSLE